MDQSHQKIVGTTAAAWVFHPITLTILNSARNYSLSQYDAYPLLKSHQFPTVWGLPPLENPPLEKSYVLII